MEICGPVRRQGASIPARGCHDRDDVGRIATLGDIAFTLDGVLQPFDIVPAEASYGCDIEVAVL